MEGKQSEQVLDIDGQNGKEIEWTPQTGGLKREKGSCQRSDLETDWRRLLAQPMMLLYLLTESILNVSNRWISFQTSVQRWIKLYILDPHSH